jgi:KipI family sensor histidine kinase inhibitor
MHVRRLTALLRSDPPAGVDNLHPAYASVLIRFDPMRLRIESLTDHIVSLLERVESLALPEPRRIEIPVRYGGQHGPDLDDVARHTGLSAAEVVRRHAAAEYEVCFFGFTPGFPYMTGLDPQLATPRLPTPRTRVPAGSVAIGGFQTGVYPLASPGGWRLIGWTPRRLFDPAREPVSLLEIGDRVRFVADRASAEETS